ncbi:MAG: hypothetical protein HC813_04135 [Planctomycetes bacterium]|nr:hypothetical protein [Planctomycetota bacterium]
MAGVYLAEYGQQTWLGRVTQFIGLDAVARIGYETKRDESTRCYFCKNKCLRTFIDVKTENERKEEEKRRLIIATCEKGEVEDIDAMRKIKAGLDAARSTNPNLAAFAAKRVWQDFKPTLVADPVPPRPLLKSTRVRADRMKARAALRIGIPRVLNQYSVNPFFTAYFGALGIPARNFVYSDFTSEALYREGRSAARSTPASRARSASPTSTTCSIATTRSSRWTGSSSRWWTPCRPSSPTCRPPAPARRSPSRRRRRRPPSRRRGTPSPSGAYATSIPS